VIVVSDASPIHYLVLTGNIDLLPALFGQVIIPQKVQEELRAPAAPDGVRQWIELAPGWLEVQTAPPYTPPKTLNEGERQTISLALSLKADVVLIDERKGRKVAEQAGLMVLDVPAVLVAAFEKGLLRLEDTVQSLQALLSKTNFRIDPEIIGNLIQKLIGQHKHRDVEN
jgi:predicted nucleic acid-binding protein